LFPEQGARSLALEKQTTTNGGLSNDRLAFVVVFA
jgi:hypothetical protein